MIGINVTIMKYMDEELPDMDELGEVKALLQHVVIR